LGPAAWAAALVFDNSLFGFTSPFFGHRYRFEIAVALHAEFLGIDCFVLAMNDARRLELRAELGAHGQLP